MHVLEAKANKAQPQCKRELPLDCLDFTTIIPTFTTSEHLKQNTFTMTKTAPLKKKGGRFLIFHET